MTGVLSVLQLKLLFTDLKKIKSFIQLLDKNALLVIAFSLMTWQNQLFLISSFYIGAILDEHFMNKLI